MILYCHKCLSSKGELEYLQGIFDYIMVDEFQIQAHWVGRDYMI